MIRSRDALQDTALIAVFAALIAVFTALVPGFALGPVALTLQTLAVALSGLILGPLRGTLAVLLYMGVGLAGLPVFSQGQAGVGVLGGGSAGYLLGFPLAALLIGALARLCLRGQRQPVSVAAPAEERPIGRDGEERHPRRRWEERRRGRDGEGRPPRRRWEERRRGRDGEDHPPQRWLTGQLTAVAVLGSLLVIHPAGILGLMLNTHLTWQAALVYDLRFWPGDLVKGFLAGVIAVAVHRAFPALAARPEPAPLPA